MKLATFLNGLALRFFRLLLGIAAIGLLATFIAPETGPHMASVRVATMFAEPVAIDPADPARRRIGGLIYRRGWVLTGDDPWFGGISAMHVADGAVLAIADTGNAFRFRLPDRAGIAPVRITSLQNHRAGQRWRSRDAESVAVFGDKAWIGYEGTNQVWRYGLPRFRPERWAAPPPMRRWGENTGAESLARLADGRFLAIAEDPSDDRPFSQAALFSGDPTQPGTRVGTLRYRRVPGARPTDTAQLPDGRLLILNRHFGLLTGLWASLVIADPAGVRPGGTIEWREVARLAPPLTVDNMEALSVGCDRGRTIVYLASDNNLLPIQRTLFLEFELAAPFAGRCPG